MARCASPLYAACRRCRSAQVMVQAGAYVQESVCRALVVLLANDPPLHAYAARALYAALKEHLIDAAPSLAFTATWFLGQFSFALLSCQSHLLIYDVPACKACVANCSFCKLLIAYPTALFACWPSRGSMNIFEWIASLKVPGSTLRMAISLFASVPGMEVDIRCLSDCPQT